MKITSFVVIRKRCGRISHWGPKEIHFTNDSSPERIEATRGYVTLKFRILVSFATWCQRFKKKFLTSPPEWHQASRTNLILQFSGNSLCVNTLWTVEANDLFVLQHLTNTCNTYFNNNLQRIPKLSKFLTKTRSPSDGKSKQICYCWKAFWSEAETSCPVVRTRKDRTLPFSRERWCVKDVQRKNIHTLDNPNEIIAAVYRENWI